MSATLPWNQERMRKWGFLTDTSGGYGPNTEAAYTLALNKLESLYPLPGNPITTLAPASLVLTPQAGTFDDLTVLMACELIEHEAIVLEAYKDSKNIWTWGVGVTDNSGHKVARYKDTPATLERVLEIYVWLLRTNYLPDVLKAFKGIKLTESQLGAALSFHYNTGAILTTQWVKDILAGRTKEARAFLETHYLNDGTLTKRRKLEAALFFDGKWTTDGKATVLEVNKPSYQPKWSSAKQVDVTGGLSLALAA